MKEITLKKIPVILDTDAGTDIDDMWAIALALNCPELDLKLITTTNGNTLYRARLVAKFLEIAGRSDIPVGVGPVTSDIIEAQGPWIENYSLDNYSGTIYEDGIDAMLNTIMGSKEKITIISIGPVTNIAKALERNPDIVKNARFVGMQGSVRKGYNASDEICAEYNVKADPLSCQKVFTSDLEITITPLDTCGLVKLRGEKYIKVHNCKKPLIKALMENYCIWDKMFDADKFSLGYGKESSILYDTVAIYLAFSEELLKVEELGIKVTDDGYTVIDENAKKIRCATEWKNFSTFEDFIVERLTREE